MIRSLFARAALVLSAAGNTAAQTPTTDIAVLQRIGFVMKDGIVHRDDR